MNIGFQPVHECVRAGDCIRNQSCEELDSGTWLLHYHHLDGFKVQNEGEGR